jgi:hypothetical protein
MQGGKNWILPKENKCKQVLLRLSLAGSNDFIFKTTKKIIHLVTTDTIPLIFNGDLGLPTS